MDASPEHKHTDQEEEGDQCGHTFSFPNRTARRVCEAGRTLTTFLRSLPSWQERLVAPLRPRDYRQDGSTSEGGGVPSRVESEKWRILPVGEVHDQPAA